jgi:hypothetical protein
MSTAVPALSAAKWPQPPIAVWGILVVLALAMAWGVSDPNGEEVDAIVVKADLPAYHLIVPADLETSIAYNGSIPPGGSLDEKALLGRVTREAIPSGRPVGSGEVTASKVAPAALVGAKLVLKPARSSAVGVETGEAVELRLAPTVSDAGLRGADVPALLLNTGEEGGKPYTVAVARREVDQLLDLVGRSDLFITPRL